MTYPHPKRSFVPQAVLTRSGKLSTAGAAVNTVRPVNTANTKAVNTVRSVNTSASKPIVNHPRTKTNVFKRGYSQSSRPFNKHFANKKSIINTNVNTARVKHTTARDRAVGNPQQKEYKEKAVIDSGCSRHMTGNKCYLDEYEDYDGGFVSFGDGKGRISRKGKIKSRSLDFDDVYFCKELKYNLLSVSQICDKKNNVLFTDTECLVLSSNFKLLDESQVLLRVPRKDNIYIVDLKSVVPTRGLTCLIAKATIDESNTWHRRLGHINFKTMNKLVKGNLVKGLPSKIFENDHSCVACQKGKQHKASYKTKLVNSISKPLHMLHMDLFGPTNDETSGILKTFITEIENQLDHKVKVIRSDNGTEFKNSIMNQFCEMKGIKREFSVARTPQQNGVAERKNRTLIEAARTMLVDSKLPNTFWAEVVNIACYVLNRVIVIKPHNKTPYKLIRGRPPLIDFMKPFGCHVTILNTRDHLGKFDGKADEGYFVGYYVVNWLFDVDSLSISMNYVPVVVGNKTYGIVGTKDNIVAGQAQKEKEPEQEYILIPLCTTDPLISQGPKDCEGDAGMKTTEVDENEASDKSGKHDQEARSESESLNQREMQTEHTNSSNGINTISTPINTAGTSFDTAVPSPPVNTVDLLIEAIRLFLDYASFKDFVVYQMDVKSAFLYGKIEEEVYVCQPPGFEDPYFPDKVYKVEKALYGLHQAPRASYETLSTYLLHNGFHRGQIDKTLFIKRHKDDILLVHVYVDDIIFGSTKKEMSIKIEKLMHDNQDKYVVEILKKFNFASIKTASTPMETNKALIKDEEAEDVDVHLYRSMIGSLMYLTASRPDIIYLKGQPKLGLWYPRDSPFDLEAFSDSDYAGASLDRKSTTGGFSISWQEIDFMAIQVLLIQNQMLDYDYFLTSNIYIDNESTICSGPRCQDTILGDVDAQTRFKTTSKQSNDPPLSKVNTFGSGEDSMQFMELITHCTKLSALVKLKSDGIFISQDKYVVEILKKFDFALIKTASTPMETNKALIKDEEVEDMDVHLYRSMIGSLMYLTASRPDIMFVVCACAKFQVTPKTLHFNAVKMIFRYLKGTKDNIIAGQAQNEKEPEQEYILIHLCTNDPLISQGPKDSEGDAGMMPTELDENEVSNKSGKNNQEARSASERLNQSEMQTDHTNSTNGINTVSTPVSTVGPSFDTAAPSTLVNAIGPSISTADESEEQLFERFAPFKNAFTLPPVPNISSMDNINIFGYAYDDEDVEEEVDMNNVISSYSVPDPSFTKFHKDHPKDQVIGSLKTTV
ncbi:putative ribonuclease H-like domain-containing protein [Tanacetum coccineum]|uniref:Ribonuclease H-like domain-containing protein n=1 Tax=Tanacetum coccineum TaxID=301880 RepID=A0ABQ4ZPY6_9ASTR